MTADTADSGRAARPVLLRTKFTRPLAHSCLVQRPRLNRRLDQVLDAQVTLVSAPPGYGKTTLVSEWAAAAEMKVAWLTIDAADNDPRRFWRYLVAALGNVHPRLGGRFLSAMAEDAVPDWVALVSILIEEIANTQEPMVLVLDDYYLIRTNMIHASLGTFLQYQPANLHVFILTRADPPLSLARLRVQGRLQDIRVADLRFTSDEVETFLACAVPHELAPSAIATLSSRIEGWPAGLQLAALSLRGMPPDEARRFAAAFGGGQRYVLTYLVEEVIEHQEERIQKFLLHTSLLQNLTPSLCTAVTGFEDAAQILAQLAEADLFIQPLDESGLWYRYHRLFAGALYGRLAQIDPDIVPELRRRAAAWYQERGDAADLPSRQQQLTAPWIAVPDIALGELILEPLTERELEILVLIAAGLSNQQIADQLVITVGTVKGHVTHLLGKLSAQSRTEAVAHARQAGLLQQ